MTIPTPKLDDRDWARLVAEAHAYVRDRAPGWTDLSPGDPGVVLMELFAHQTELMLYRLNQVPDKTYRELLRLMGLTLRPPAAASVILRFELERPARAPVPVPRGTRASVARSAGSAEPPVFATAEDVAIAVGERAIEVLAHHAEVVAGELVGVGTGRPGQVVRVQRPPIVAPTGSELDLVIGVEAEAGELDERVAAREHEGRSYRIWEEVDSFVHRSPRDTVFVADRRAGTVVFAPALALPDADAEGAAGPVPMAAVPAAGREIRAWYRRGGGAEGNVPAGAITVLKDSVPGVTAVTNPAAATGGRPGEALEEALVRGPQELHSIERAVTAQDYEAIAQRVGGAVARARAFTKAATWRHAAPGTVEVLLVPYVAEQELAGAHLTAPLLHAHETETTRTQIQHAVDERRPLGITTLVDWASYKTVKVHARVVVRREENPEAVKARVERRLHSRITPLPAPGTSSGWRFGQPLRASDVFDMVLKEPGVRFADSVRMEVEYAPDAGVGALAADAFQPRTWYAGAGDTVFRSTNDAESWEALTGFAGETVERIRSHPERPGLVVVVTSVEGGSRLHVSLDAGESWDRFAAPRPEFEVHDAAWSLKGNTPTLLLATDVGLYELTVGRDPTFVQLLVTPEQTRGFYAVVVAVDALGARNVAVAAQGGTGVWLSSEGGAPGTFRDAGLRGQDVRVLAVQRDGPRAYLWAGAAAPGGDDPGPGAWRWELRGAENPAEGWVAFGRGWDAGSCWDLAFRDATVYAATHHGGVVRLDARSAEAAWQPLDVNCGLPLRDPTQFLFAQIDAVAASAASGLVLGGGAQGVFGSTDGARWTTRSRREFTETVHLPDTWLFVSGDHDISVVSEDQL